MRQFICSAKVGRGKRRRHSAAFEIESSGVQRIDVRDKMSFSHLRPFFLSSSVRRPSVPFSPGRVSTCQRVSSRRVRPVALRSELQFPRGRVRIECHDRFAQRHDDSVVCNRQRVDPVSMARPISQPQPMTGSAIGSASRLELCDPLSRDTSATMEPYGRRRRPYRSIADIRVTILPRSRRLVGDHL